MEDSSFPLFSAWLRFLDFEFPVFWGGMGYNSLLQHSELHSEGGLVLFLDN